MYLLVSERDRIEPSQGDVLNSVILAKHAKPLSFHAIPQPA